MSQKPDNAEMLDQLEEIEISKGGLLAFLRCAGSRHARCHILLMLKRIRDAHRAGRRWEVEQLIRKYLTSYDARFVATIRAFRQMKPGRRPPKGQLASIASGLNAFKGTGEEVRLIFKRKRSNPNEFRPTLDFGIENRALQYLVLSILHVIADLHPRQFGVRGVPAAITHVRNAVKDGFLWATEIDIKNCYQSFDGNRIEDMIPFPKKVVEHVLTAGCISITPPMHLPHIFGPADTGETVKTLIAKYLADARQVFRKDRPHRPCWARCCWHRCLTSSPSGARWRVMSTISSFWQRTLRWRRLQPLEVLYKHTLSGNLRRRSRASLRVALSSSLATASPPVTG